MKNPMLKTALQRYLKTVSILKKGYEQEKFRINQISSSFLGCIKTREIKSFDIAEYRDFRLQQVNQKSGKQLSPATVRLELSLLSNFFDIARIEWAYSSDNPVKNVRKPKPSPGRTRRLTPREENQITKYCKTFSNPELYYIIVLALETAMRQGEILNLKWEHINLMTRVIHLPESKNGTSRDIPLSQKAKENLLRMGVKNYGKVFSYSSPGIKTTWRTMLIKLNIKDLKFHDLRHEAISRLFEKSTLDMMEISAISGHKSVALLKRYTHLKAQKLVKKLDGNKNKGRHFIVDQLNPYPAYIIHNHNHHVRITVPDLKYCVFSDTVSCALSNAQDVALRSIITRIHKNEKIPVPDQYLGNYLGDRIMIDPIR